MAAAWWIQALEITLRQLRTTFENHVGRASHRLVSLMPSTTISWRRLGRTHALPETSPSRRPLRRQPPRAQGQNPHRNPRRYTAGITG
jgi:hypothetical protein